VRVLEFGDDGHLAFELVHGAGVGLGAGEHDFHGHLSRAALLGLCQIDRTAAAAAEFAFDVVALELECRVAGFAEDELLHGLRREPGKITFRQGGIHLAQAGDIRRGLDADFDAGLAGGDAVAVLEGYAGILALRSLLRGFAFFATTAFFPVHVGAVHAAEVAQGGLGRTGFEQEMVARDLDVVRQAEVAVRHAAEQDGVVLGEIEGAGGAIGVLDLESDGGGHCYWLGVICYRGRVEEEECRRDAYSPFLRTRWKIVNLGSGRLVARRLQHGLRQDATATFTLQQPEGVEAGEAHGFEFIPKGGDGGVGEFVGGLFGNAERSTDFAVALSIADAFGDLPEPRR
jgi:hypothetical protein